MMPSVVDVAGINSFSRQIYANAAGAIAGMVSQELPPMRREQATHRGQHVWQYHGVRQPGA